MKEKLKSIPEVKSLREQALEEKISKLEKELEAAKLKAEAYNALIEVAEEELGVDIRKKAGAKQ